MAKLNKFIYLLVALMGITAITAGQSQAQFRRRPKEERGALTQIKKRAVKEARKEARKLKRDDWDVAPGSLPLEKQLENSWVMQYERNENQEMKYIGSDGNGVANTFTAAQIQAFEMAKLNLAGQIQTEIRALVEANIANQQLTSEEAATVNRVLTTSRNIIATKLNRIDPAMVIYRTLSNHNVECQVKLMYDRENAIRAASDALRGQLDQDLRNLSQKWDQMLGIGVPPVNPNGGNGTGGNNATNGANSGSDNR